MTARGQSIGAGARGACCAALLACALLARAQPESHAETVRFHTYGTAEGLSQATVEDVLMVFADAPSTSIALPLDGMPLVDMLAAVKLAASKSDATRLLKSGGVYVNNVRATDERARLTVADAIGGEVILLRKGRRDQHLVRVLRS